MPTNPEYEPPMNEDEGTGQMFSAGNPIDASSPVNEKVENLNQYSISLKEGGHKT